MKWRIIRILKKSNTDYDFSPIKCERKIIKIPQFDNEDQTEDQLMKNISKKAKHERKMQKAGPFRAP